MKKLASLILVSMALLLMGMAACTSTPKLDISTIDATQPIQVGGIWMRLFEGNERIAEFYRKYGNGSEITDEQLLKVLCGTVAENLEFIEAQLKAKTGIPITLNGDVFLQDLKDGDTVRIVRQKETSLGQTQHFLTWNVMDTESPTAIIGLLFENDGKTVVNKVNIETNVWDEWGTNLEKEKRSTVIQLWSILKHAYE